MKSPPVWLVAKVLAAAACAGAGVWAWVWVIGVWCLMDVAYLLGQKFHES